MDLKKLGSAVAVSLLSITSLAQAAGMEMDTKNCSKPCTPPPSCKRCPVGCVNPDARPARDNVRKNIALELLYWESNQGGMTYATANQEAIDLVKADVLAGAGAAVHDGFFSAASSKYYNAKSETPSHSWDLGFRLGLGYTFVHDGWDLTANWTHFRNNTKKFNNSDTEIGNVTYFAEWTSVLPGSLAVFLLTDTDTDTTARFTTTDETSISIDPLTLTPQSLAQKPVATAIEAKWKLQLDLVDLELGRDFYTSRYLTLRPFIGARGAWVKEEFDVDYSGGSFTQVGSTNSTRISLLDDVDMKSDFSGAGVRIGLNSDWKFCDGWSFYGNTAFSLLYGNFHVTQQEFLGDQDQANSSVILNMDNHFRASQAMLDLALGLRYDWDCSCYHVGAYVGWEQHILFDQNQFVHYPSTGPAVDVIDQSVTTTTSRTLYQNPPSSYPSVIPANGNLTMQGFTVGVTVDF